MQYLARFLHYTVNTFYHAICQNVPSFTESHLFSNSLCVVVFFCFLQVWGWKACCGGCSCLLRGVSSLPAIKRKLQVNPASARREIKEFIIFVDKFTILRAEDLFFKHCSSATLLWHYNFDRAGKVGWLKRFMSGQCRSFLVLKKWPLCI